MKTKDDQLTVGKHFHQEGEFWYQVAGRGRPLIFFHGYGVSPRSWQPVILALARYFLVIAPHLSESWRGWNNNGFDNFDGLIANLGGMVQKETREKVVLVGYSLGTWTAIRYAKRFPRQVKLLVIVNGLTIKVEEQPVKGFWRLISDMSAEGLKPRQFLRVGMNNLDFLINSARNPRFMNRLTEAVARIDEEEFITRSPVRKLMIWSADDKLLPLTYGKRVAEIARNCRLEVVPGPHVWGLIRPEVLVDKIKTCLG